MLRCKPPFFFIEAFGACDGIFESLPDGNLLILVFVGSRTLESLQEVVIKNDVVSLLAAARRGDDDAVFSGELFDESFLCSLGPLVEFSFVLGAAGNTPDN